jgi:hypothetical protein
MNEQIGTNTIYIQMKELNSDTEVRIEFIETCCICLEESELDYVLECCNNKIHSTCIRSWYTFKKTNICPLCRHGTESESEEVSFLQTLIPTEQEARMIVRPLLYLILYMIIVVILKMK